MFLPQEIIRHKRDGAELSADQIRFFIDELTQNRLSEGQVGAFAMAVFLQGMSARETALLTCAMRDSGQVLQWAPEFLGGPVLDKHSTGGVGDNVSLILAPAVAACGGFVPMISGRSLGHTGGTLDKLESIPGYVTTPDVTHLARVVRDIGCAIIGQTAELAPADRRLYAIRDVTATVESIPLITASILSKKMAAGLQGLVMDVKTGDGAFMPELNEATQLARSLVDVAQEAGLPTHALITPMDQPLASAVGNAVEVFHAIAHLTGARREPRLHDVILGLGSEMLLLGGLVSSRDLGRAKIEEALTSGRAAECFARMVHALGGPANLLDKPAAHLPRATLSVPVPARDSGYVTAIATRQMGLTLVEMGGGRRRADDQIDHALGLTSLAEKGQHVTRGEPLAYVHAKTADQAAWVASAVADLFTIAETAPPNQPIINRLLVPETNA